MAKKYLRIRNVISEQNLPHGQNGVRGGISTITKRYAKVNNPYVSHYSMNKSVSYLEYLNDKNSTICMEVKMEIMTITKRCIPLWRAWDQGESYNRGLPNRIYCTVNIYIIEPNLIFEPPFEYIIFNLSTILIDERRQISTLMNYAISYLNHHDIASFLIYLSCKLDN